MTERKEGFFRTILTEDKKNRDFDPLRIAFFFVMSGGIIGLWLFLVMTLFEVLLRGREFDETSFATSLGIITAGLGALIIQTGLALWASSNQKENEGPK